MRILAINRRLEVPIDFRAYRVEASISRGLDGIPEHLLRARFRGTREGLGLWDFIEIETEVGKVLIGQSQLAGHAAVVWTERNLTWEEVKGVIEEIFQGEVLVMNPDTGEVI